MTKMPMLLAACLIASCGGEEREPVQATQTVEQLSPQPPPPLPALPGSSYKPIPEAKALEAAKRKAAGDCNDLLAIQALPLKKQFGFDPYYDRIMVHIDAYAPCLLQAASSTAPTRVEASFPGLSFETVGDLAFVLLVHGDKIAWGECSPAEVIARESEEDASAFYAWLKQPGARAQWHDCLVRRHGARRPEASMP